MEFPVLAETTEGFSQGFGISLVEMFSSNIRYDCKTPSNQDMLKLQILHTGVEGYMAACFLVVVIY